MSCGRNVWSGDYSVGELSGRGNPCRELSVGELSVGELSSQGTVRIPIFSGSIKNDQWHEMSQIPYYTKIT